jgi:hypothetical protein
MTGMAGMDALQYKIHRSMHHVSLMTLIPRPYWSNWYEQHLSCRCGWRIKAGPACPSPCKEDGHPCARSMVLEAHKKHALEMIANEIGDFNE